MRFLLCERNRYNTAVISGSILSRIIVGGGGGGRERKREGDKFVRVLRFGPFGCEEVHYAEKFCATVKEGSAAASSGAVAITLGAIPRRYNDRQRQLVREITKTWQETRRDSATT